MFADVAAAHRIERAEAAMSAAVPRTRYSRSAILSYQSDARPVCLDRPTNILLPRRRVCPPRAPDDGVF
jgi:hypothetical protein